MFATLLKYKKLIITFMIIVVLLIFIKEQGFKRLTENFENANLVDVLNGLDVQDQKLNDMIKETSLNTVTFNKIIKTNKEIKVGDQITIGPHGKIQATELALTHIITSVQGDDKASLNKTDIKKMKSLKNIAGYAINGNGSTHLLFEGGWYNLNEGKFVGWSNDTWDLIYLFKGWKVEVSQHSNGEGWVKWAFNNNKDVKRWNDFPSDKITSYKVTWIDY